MLAESPPGRYGRDVGELGNLLELLYGAGERWRSARLTVREWHHSEGSQRAHERLQRSGASQLTFYGPGPVAEEHETVTRVWIALDRVREEREEADAHLTLSIRNGDRWWLYSPQIGAHANDGSRNHVGGVGEVALRLLEPSHVLAALRLEAAGEVRAAGRTALRVRATDRGREDTAMLFFQLGYGADSYELAVDRERGVLLRTAALLDGEPFAITEVTEIAFDEEFPPETFTFELPEGESFRPASGGFEHGTLAAAAARAPFTVLTPEVVPEGWQLRVPAQEGEVLVAGFREPIRDDADLRSNRARGHPRDAQLLGSRARHPDRARDLVASCATRAAADLVDPGSIGRGRPRRRSLPPGSPRQRAPSAASADVDPRRRNFFTATCCIRPQEVGVGIRPPARRRIGTQSLHFRTGV